MQDWKKSAAKEGNMPHSNIEQNKLALCIVLLFMTSCTYPPPDIVTHKGMHHTDLEAYFRDKTTTLSDAIQPLNVICPLCKSEGYYIQSVFVQSALPGATNILHSQYVCTNSHEWLIGQRIVGGAVSPIMLLLK